MTACGKQGCQVTFTCLLATIPTCNLPPTSKLTFSSPQTFSIFLYCMCILTLYRCSSGTSVFVHLWLVAPADILIWVLVFDRCLLGWEATSKWGCGEWIFFWILKENRNNSTAAKWTSLYSGHIPLFADGILEEMSFENVHVNCHENHHA